jgi:hypothetical protein
MTRCTHTYGVGPQCCLDEGHEGDHLFKCCSSTCPGLPIPASVVAHPVNCGAGGAKKLVGRICYLCGAQFDAEPGETGCRR